MNTDRAPNTFVTPEPLFQQDVLAEITREHIIGIEGAQLIVHIEVENQIIKSLVKEYWLDTVALLEKLRTLVYNESFEYDDRHNAYSRRKLGPSGQYIGRETYQIIDRFYYEWSKEQLGLNAPICNATAPR